LAFKSTLCFASIDYTNQALIIPKVSDAKPTAGLRVKQVHKEYQETQIYHTLFLPTNWDKTKKYPVIIEYPGNKWRDYSGTVEACKLGYGLSGGKDVIWVCLPFIDTKNKMQTTTWWGDVKATVDYCKKTIELICSKYGGDPNNLFIAGFSRGSIACNYIGLHDDEIAALWKGFICHSHYDGVRKWPYKNSDISSAALRLKRLKNRPQFISQEKNITPIRQYLKKTYPKGNFKFLEMPSQSHNDTWVLQKSKDSDLLKRWFWENVKKP